MTADDVVFTFNMLTTKGDPQYALYYGDVAKAEAVAQLKVKFTFKASANRELPVILGQMPVLPKHDWEGKTFDQTTLRPAARQRPLQGRFTSRPGATSPIELDPNYWGAKLPVNVGRNNFDMQRFDYYKDPNVALSPSWPAPMT